MVYTVYSNRYWFVSFRIIYFVYRKNMSCEQKHIDTRKNIGWNKMLWSADMWYIYIHYTYIIYQIYYYADCELCALRGCNNITLSAIE